MRAPAIVVPGNNNGLLFDADDLGIKTAQDDEIAFEGAFVPDGTTAGNEGLPANDMRARAEWNTPNRH